MNPRRDVVTVAATGLGIAVLVGAAVGHVIDLLIHRHRQEQ